MNDIDKSIQTCQHCGQKNSAANAYCQKCGQMLNDNQASDQSAAGHGPTSEEISVGQLANNRRTKIILTSLAVLALLAAVFGGWYVWSKQRIAEQTRQYLVATADNFSKTINDINQLSTEKEIDSLDSDEAEQIVEKFEQEQTKTEIWLHDLSLAKDDLENSPANRLVAPLDTLLRQFYEESREKGDTYARYVDYNVMTGREMARFLTEMDKIGNNYKSITSESELRSVFLSLRDEVDTANNNIKAIQPPSGLEPAHDKSVEMLTSLSQNLTGIVSAIEEQDDQKLMDGITALSDMFSDSQKVSEIDDLERYYFDEMHKKFESLRRKADTIKEEFIVLKTTYKSALPTISIEGW